MSALSTAGLVIACIGGFIAIWLLACALIALIGGWTRLAEDFRSEGHACPPRVLLGGAYMRFITHYSNVIRISGGSDGLALSVLLPFGFCHPPLLIPWDQIEAQEFKSLGIFPAMKLLLGRDAHIPLTFYSSAAREVIASHQAQLISNRISNC